MAKCLGPAVWLGVLLDLQSTALATEEVPLDTPLKEAGYRMITAKLRQEGSATPQPSFHQPTADPVTQPVLS